MYAEDRERIIRNVRESVEEAGQSPEDSAYYFVIGLCVAIFAGLILITANVKYKTNQLDMYGQKIKEEIAKDSDQSNKDLQVDDLNNQIASLQLALSKRIDFGKFFKDLSQNQYKRSKWSSISLNSEKVSISMEADNFEDMSKSVKAFENMPSLRHVSLSNVNVNSGNSVSYTLDLIVDYSAYKVVK